MKGKLVIENVDLELLEQQRKILNCLEFSIVHSGNGFVRVTQQETSALIGVLNMLDNWSDKEYFKKQDEIPTHPTTKQELNPVSI
uniref:Uncharacterized protein n=1 Tax=viral metagenome TaxID=1070528 RepID=A0A6M3IMS7_9ZZZZ